MQLRLELEALRLPVMTRIRAVSRRIFMRNPG